ncbi:MAG: hypothetical protein ACE5HE_02455, partial [Phycisphaerae bacterium]
MSRALGSVGEAEWFPTPVTCDAQRAVPTRGISQHPAACVGALGAAENNGSAGASLAAESDEHRLACLVTMEPKG